MSVLRKRNSAVRWRAGSGVLGRMVAVKELSHCCVGRSDFEARWAEIWEVTLVLLAMMARVCHHMLLDNSLVSE